MKTLRLHVVHVGRGTTLFFQRFPVRIGRDPASDCLLAFAFVSRRHARLDLDGDRLLLRDEGSRRGTFVHGGRQRLAPGEVVDLSEYGYEFQIGSIVLRAELRDDGLAGDADAGTGHAAPPSSPPLNSVSHHPDDDRDLGPFTVDAMRAALDAALDQHAKGRRALEDVLLQIGVYMPARVPDFARQVVGAGAPWETHEAARAFVAKSGIRPAPARTESMALRALEELSAHYARAAPPLEGLEAVETFVERVDLLLEVVLEGVDRLRTAFGVQGQVPDPIAPGELLDWTDDGRAIAQLRDRVAEVVTLHERMADEATGSLEHVLGQLDPRRIEQACGGPATWNPLRYRSFWRELALRHDAIVRARADALGPTFGWIAEGGPDEEPSSVRPRLRPLALTTGSASV